jgi:hypothetical protein
MPLVEWPYGPPAKNEWPVTAVGLLQLISAYFKEGAKPQDRWQYTA